MLDLPGSSGGSEATVNPNPQPRPPISSDSSRPMYTEEQLAGEPSSSGSANLTALEQKANDLILDNLEIRKTEKAEGQDTHALRRAVEQGNNICNVPDLFQAVQELKAEKERPMKESPFTNTALNEVKDFQSHVQDGRGGGKPSNRENCT